MSAQEFKVGQQVSGDDYERLPVGSKVSHGRWPERTKADADQWPADNDPDDVNRTSDMRQPRTLTHLGDGTHVTEPSVDNSEDLTEPEDADDVEPEPLKEGDWCLVWARFGRTDNLDVTHVEMPMSYGRVHDGYVRPGAIVRPDAGHVPPWVKPAQQCTSLKEHDGVLVRCTGTPVERCEKHGAPFSPSVLIWTDAEEYGRLVESDGAS